MFKQTILSFGIEGVRGAVQDAMNPRDETARRQAFGLHKVPEPLRDDLCIRMTVDGGVHLLQRCRGVFAIADEDCFRVVVVAVDGELLNGEVPFHPTRGQPIAFADQGRHRRIVDLGRERHLRGDIVTDV
ncbi:hypothetical protein D3C87_1720300 [compost metagenome]